jgi:hypothetical protein
LFTSGTRRSDAEEAGAAEDKGDVSFGLAIKFASCYEVSVFSFFVKSSRAKRNQRVQSDRFR